MSVLFRKINAEDAMLGLWCDAEGCSEVAAYGNADVVHPDGSIVAPSECPAFDKDNPRFLCEECVSTDAIEPTPVQLQEPTEQDDGCLRTFETGATRDTAEGKLDYEGFLSPDVLRSFAEYMHENRVQSDGSLRDSDNWQKGIPREVYMKSMWRHFMDVWTLHRRALTSGEHIADSVRLEEALNAMLFNVQGMLHEILKGATVSGDR